MSTETNIIFNKDQLEANRSNINSFVHQYNDAFPDENEREKWEEIEERIVDVNSYPRTFILFENFINPNGGIVADIYHHIGVIHLIYIVVNKKQRRTGIATKLVLELLPKAILKIEYEFGFNVSSILFESNLPWLTNIDSFNPKLRLQIFEKFGARHLPFDYFQPPLEPHKNYVEYLNLFAFPAGMTMNNSSIEKNQLLAFLKELYIGLGIENPEVDDKYIKMKNEIDVISNMNQLKLTSIPQIEEPRMKMKRVSICFQFTIEVENEKQTKTGKCPEFYSYETDLLSSHFQKRRPFKTDYNQELGVLPITIYFPQNYSYLSEGKRHQRVSLREKVSANIHLNKTLSCEGNNCTWSVVISNEIEDYFSEIECIKLLNFFGSKQEDSEMISLIEFDSKNIGKCNFYDFVQELIGTDSIDDFSILSGIIQTDTAHIDLFENDHKLEFNWSDFYLNLKFYNDGNQLAEQQFERMYYNDINYQNVYNIFCGLALGIFDFERMDFDEVTDTLIPRKANENYVLLLNRGVLLCACHEDDMYQSTLNSIGMSPYLVIPNMVLVNNEFVLNQVAMEIEKVEEHKKEYAITLNDLRNTLSKIDSMMNEDFLSNVFQYPSEKDLYEFGLDHRGIKIFKAEIENQIQSLENLKEDQIANRQEKSDLIMTLILTLLSGVQFQEMFQSFTNGDFILSWMWTIMFSITLTGAIYYFSKSKTRN